MDITLLIALASIFLLGLRLGRLDEQIKQNKLKQEELCPHGYDDSDKCPDCCH